MIFEALGKYEKDLKKLAKRYKTLSEDIEVLKKVLAVEPGERPPVSYRIGGLGLKSIIIKVKRIACRSLKNMGSNTGLRLIYCYEKSHENIERKKEKIHLIELYHKSDKENEDRVRIKKYFN